MAATRTYEIMKDTYVTRKYPRVTLTRIKRVYADDSGVWALGQDGTIYEQMMGRSAVFRLNADLDDNTLYYRIPSFIKALYKLGLIDKNKRDVYLAKVEAVREEKRFKQCAAGIKVYADKIGLKLTVAQQKLLDQ